MINLHEVEDQAGIELKTPRSDVIHICSQTSYRLRYAPQPLIVLFSVGLNTINGNLNQYKTVEPLFGATVIYSNKKETSDFHGTVSFDPVKMLQQK